MSFQPAISQEALKKIGAVVRSWRLHHRTGSTFAQLARAINPVVTGWMRYYGALYPSALHPLLHVYQLLPGALDPLQISAAETGEESPSRLQTRGPDIPSCSDIGSGHHMPGEQDDKSRVTGDCYARICGSPGVRFPWATRLVSCAGNSLKI